MEIPSLTAIAEEVSETLVGVKLSYWSPDDQSRNPGSEHIFGVVNLQSPIAVDGLILCDRTIQRCGHSFHTVKLNGTVLKIGDCLIVDLADPKSIQQIIDFYKCHEFVPRNVPDSGQRNM